MFKTVKSKILFIQIFGILVLGLCMGLSSYFIMKHYLELAVKNNMIFAVDIIATKIGHEIDEQANTIVSISESKELEIYHEKYKEIPLKELFLRLNSDIPILSYVNNEGMEEVKLINGVESIDFQDISKTDIFQASLSEPNKVFVSKVENNNLLGEPVIKFIINKKSYFGDHFLGFISGVVPLSRFNQYFLNVNLSKTGFVSLIDNNGRILFHPQKNKILSKILIEDEKAKKIISGAMGLKTGFGRATIMGVDGFISYAPVKNMAWSLMATIPYNEFIEAPHSLRNTCTAIFVTIFILILIITYVQSQKISGPISKLALASDRIAKGDFLQGVEIDSEDELGVLEQSFNRMSDELLLMTSKLVTKEYVEKILENMYDMLIVTDPGSNIKNVNKITTDILGYRKEMLIGKPVSFVLADEEKETFERNALKELIQNGRLFNLEIVYKASDGKKLNVIFHGSVIRDEKGAITDLICIALDITERKKIEVSLKEYADQIEYVNKELDSFTYIVSHDLKEPLRSINSFTKFIVSDYKDRLDKEGKEYLSRIEANASRMQKLIEDLLEVSRIERNKNPIEEVEVKNIIEEAKLRLDLAITEKNARIIYDADKLPRIFCDRVRLTEVFANLLSNAVKFADKFPPVIEIGCNKQENYFEFYVKDNGPGIEKQYFEKIFLIFQRLVKREDKEGTGVGLTIVKKIVELHKGKIWLESEVGQGTTFFFTIPKSKDDILGKKKIGELLVEKKLVSAEDIKKALEEQKT